MKVVVLGAGVVGITTAWYLHKAGHEVVVIDQNKGPALGTSFGNAGGLCPSFAGPWAAPGMPLKAIKWLFKQSAPLKIRPKLDLSQWRWLMSFWANCTPERFAQNKKTMQRIAHYSLACLQELRRETNITYDNQSKGILHLFQTADEFEYGRSCAGILNGEGVSHELLDNSGILKIEPALSNSELNFSGGLHYPNDETGDCHLFCVALSAKLKDAGVSFQYGTTIQNIVVDGDEIEHVAISNGAVTGDAYVVALGAHVVNLMRPLGIHLPIYPVKGYSLTATIPSDDAAPISSIMDEHSKIMMTRLGSRLRVAGVAELAGFDKSIKQIAKTNLLARTNALFPGSIQEADCQWWTGFRPMTPDGPAKLGKTAFKNLFLNVGHGSNGWTQACGASKIVADIVSEKEPDIDIGKQSV